MIESDENKWPGITTGDVLHLAWLISNGTGFSRKSDLVLNLRDQYPGISEKQSNELINAAFDDQNLAMGYIFATNAGDGISGKVVNIFNRMLCWNTPLHISELKEGLSRRFRFDQLPAVPPLQVIRSLIKFLPNFEISDDYVSSTVSLKKDTGTVLGWIGSLLDESPYKTLHKSTIFGKARQSGQNQSSIDIYLLYGELVKPVGRSCFTLIGEFPTADQIEQARHQALLENIPGRVNTTNIRGQEIRLEVTIGTNMRNRGNVPIAARLRRIIGDRTFSIKSMNGSHGTSRIYNGSATGFRTVMSALDIVPGDEITLNFDLKANTVFVEQ